MHEQSRRRGARSFIVHGVPENGTVCTTNVGVD